MTQSCDQISLQVTLENCITGAALQLCNNGSQGLVEAITWRTTIQDWIKASLEFTLHRRSEGLPLLSWRWKDCKQQPAETVDIGVQGHGLVPGLLGAHVCRGPHDLTCLAGLDIRPEVTKKSLSLAVPLAISSILIASKVITQNKAEKSAPKAMRQWHPLWECK